VRVLEPPCSMSRACTDPVVSWTDIGEPVRTVIRPRVAMKKALPAPGCRVGGRNYLEGCPSIRRRRFRRAVRGRTREAFDEYLHSRDLRLAVDSHRVCLEDERATVHPAPEATSRNDRGSPCTEEVPGRQNVETAPTSTCASPLRITYIASP
jgi:hypothetical protein